MAREVEDVYHAFHTGLPSKVSWMGTDWATVAVPPCIPKLVDFNFDHAFVYHGLTAAATPSMANPTTC
jgi:hypothetical protein